MLCCVSKRALAGADHGPPYREHAPPVVTPQRSLSVVLERIELELYPDEDVPPILLPCAICARTFMPQSLEKHKRICERTAVKKRKPFDSAKQRIQGTELAEFLPKEQQQQQQQQQEKKRHQEDRPQKAKSSWKQTHDEFVRAIRAARGDVADQSNQRQCSSTGGGSVVSSGAPTRANEKGACPTCNRQFGIKAYDRHVAWCRERATRLPLSPATDVAKKRLEARIKYRAPALKNRRLTNREKYSLGSSSVLNTSIGKPAPSAATPSTSVGSARLKETASAPSCNKTSSPVAKHRPSVLRRSLQTKDSPVSSVPMKSRLADRHISGTCKDYDPFLLAEQQMIDLLSDTSDHSVTDDVSSPARTRESSFPLSPSSAFVKYPFEPPSPSLTHQQASSTKRSSLIAPPMEFDDLTSDFSSDSTETNSLSRELFFKELKDSFKDTSLSKSPEQTSKLSPPRELGRRVIIDKSKALGSVGTGEVVEDHSTRGTRSFVASTERAKKILDKVSPAIVRPAITRSGSIRASSAPKAPLERKNLGGGTNLGNTKKASSPKRAESRKPGATDANANVRSNVYEKLSGSNLSLSSIVSSEMDIKRSNSMFEELMTSFEDDGSSYPSLGSFLKNESLSMSMSSPVPMGRQRNGQISDEELSSPESYKRNDHSKLSADSAYSSLNRKYSNHGRSTSDVANRYEEDAIVRNNNAARCKMSKFCHECGSKFPETAKFCCECGIKRLAF